MGVESVYGTRKTSINYSEDHMATYEQVLRWWFKSDLELRIYYYYLIGRLIVLWWLSWKFGSISVRSFAIWECVDLAGRLGMILDVYRCLNGILWKDRYIQFMRSSYEFNLLLIIYFPAEFNHITVTLYRWLLWAISCKLKFKRCRYHTDLFYQLKNRVNWLYVH